MEIFFAKVNEYQINAIVHFTFENGPFVRHHPLPEMRVVRPPPPFPFPDQNHPWERILYAPEKAEGQADRVVALLEHGALQEKVKKWIVYLNI